jgi:hypothetical protein
MDGWLDRVVEEKEQLDGRLQKLQSFMKTPVFTCLTPAEQQRLVRQEHHMAGYSAVLEERIGSCGNQD